MMKQIKTVLLMLGIALSLSCSKEKTAVDINEKDLTNCEGNGKCQYLFTEQADLNTPPFSFKSGSYRLFWAANVTGPMTQTLYIKAPMKGTEFSLNDKDILDGKVVYSQSCPSCDYIAFKPIGGYVKGRNVTPDKPSDKTKWILEAKILLEAISDSNVKSTFYIKQYFYPNFVYN